MWIRGYDEVFQGVSRASIWKIWTNIDEWPLWHGDLEYCKIMGPFQVGNHFMLKPKGMRAVKIMITDIKEGYSFTDCTVFPGAKMFDTHSMEETPEGLRIANKLVVTGPLKWLWIKLVAQHVADTIGDETQALINLARNAGE